VRELLVAVRADVVVVIVPARTAEAPANKPATAAAAIIEVVTFFME
jgi:hypothetical protein